MKRLKPNTTMMRQLLPGGVFGPWFGVDTRTGQRRKRWWTKARVPGTVRSTRMPGGSGYRGDKLWEGG
jgi:hypothetical protein